MMKNNQFSIQKIFIPLLLFIIPIQAQYTPNDPYWGNQWGHTQVQADYAWTMSTGQLEILVGVIDTGVQMNHEDLQGKIWYNPDEIPGNGNDDDGNGYIDDMVVVVGGSNPIATILTGQRQ
jgi:hypothetical protein